MSPCPHFSIAIHVPTSYSCLPISTHVYQCSPILPVYPFDFIIQKMVPSRHHHYTRTTAVSSLIKDTSLFYTNPNTHILVWDLRDSSKLVGACNTLRFVCDEAIGTSILTDAYLSKNSLPRFDTQWTLLDIICSRRSPAATLLAMSVYAAVSKGRTRKAVGLLAISINERSRKVFHKLGFMEHKFKSQGDTFDI